MFPKAWWEFLFVKLSSLVQKKKQVLNFVQQLEIAIKNYWWTTAFRVKIRALPSKRRYACKLQLLNLLADSDMSFLQA